ncbi:cyanidin 3-O-rutinoside 5-O-glucosyltransferase-like [Phalaenopsis equestris]|uniref:cyanidin 3-O-rutinoside 5-O-glucosyltransferase-like n=1 Tax=Phalaenopsis equestris TaxID=78828 RepID=UPI0009E249A1|nr:cyanidin 3-O-rutinoside 5-O-glucosyltransferase-like [Phalaenopsis equestris]
MVASLSPRSLISSYAMGRKKGRVYGLGAKSIAFEVEISRVSISCTSSSQSDTKERARQVANMNEKLHHMREDNNHVLAAKTSKELFEKDKRGYMEWLDAQKERSVVYVAVSSLTLLTLRQVEELDMELKVSGQPYFLVLRKDNRPEGIEMDVALKLSIGMVVEWCSQVRVLDHKVVGCFVTHGGWNSTSEAIVNGVPMVMLPQWIEQVTNARLVEAAWGIGVKAEAGEDGVVEAAELRRGLDVVMGDDDRAREIRKKVGECKEKARAAVAQDRSSSKKP